MIVARVCTRIDRFYRISKNERTGDASLFGKTFIGESEENRKIQNNLMFFK